MSYDRLGHPLRERQPGVIGDEKQDVIDVSEGSEERPPVSDVVEDRKVVYRLMEFELAKGAKANRVRGRPRGTIPDATGISGGPRNAQIEK